MRQQYSMFNSECMIAVSLLLEVTCVCNVIAYSWFILVEYNASLFSITFLLENSSALIYLGIQELHGLCLDPSKEWGKWKQVAKCLGEKIFRGSCWWTNGFWPEIFLGLWAKYGFRLPKPEPKGLSKPIKALDICSCLWKFSNSISYAFGKSIPFPTLLKRVFVRLNIFYIFLIIRDSLELRIPISSQWWSISD